MASAAQPDVSELEKKDAPAAGEEADNPEEPMDEDDDENDEGGDGDDVEEDVIVQIGATYSCKRQDGSYHDVEIVKTRMNKQAGREEFFVHYVGLNRRQNEWVEKTRLVIPKPVKEGQAANIANPEVTEDGKAPPKRKNDDSTPDAKKVKVDPVNDSSTNSVMASGDFAEELTCLLCSELFKDPVMVECGHNFCRNCIDKAWDGQDSFTCPDCKEVITDKRYTTNRALANLVKKTVGTTALTSTKPNGKPKVAENCPVHDERVKLYCKEDGTLSCVICRDSLKHASHNFLPILDAVAVYRTELSDIVAPLEEALKVTEQLTDQQQEKVEQHKNNVSESRLHIESEFEKLRTFLREREEKLLDTLNEQGENLLKEMEANMVKMQENRDNIKQTITMASERTNDTDSISFLTGIKSFIEKCQEQQKDVMVAGNTLLSKDLCQGTFKGPVQYSTWKQMKSFILPYGKTVWIVGHSFVFRAQIRAASTDDGTQLGFSSDKCRLFWYGKEYLMWSEVKQLIADAADRDPPPDILVIHAGGNDLTAFKTPEITRNIKADIDSWLERWPGLIVVWSNIMQRKYWQHVTRISVLEGFRRKVNAVIGKYVLLKGGLVLNHDDIAAYNSKLYEADGESLSDVGLDRFNKSIQKMLETCL